MDEQARLHEAGFEPVYVENDWYDGPRAGLASIGGLPHYFAFDRYTDPDSDAAEFFVWPTDHLTLELEREQWGIYCAWNARYEAGEADVDTHPGDGGVDARYDELTLVLSLSRNAPPEARRLVPEWRHFDRPGSRYLPEGPGYLVRWHPAEPGST